MNDFLVSEGVTDDDVPVYYLPVGGENELPNKAADGDFDFTYGDKDKDGKTLYNGEYYVRAVYNTGAGEEGKYYVSAASSVVNITLATDMGNNKISRLEDKDVPSALGEDAVIMGVINSEKYDFSEVGLGEKYDLYDSTENSGYRSTSSKNLLMIHSKYETYAGYQSSSVTFSANSYYRISVWVKTIGDAKASVTLANTSNAYELNTEYPGYDSANNGRYEGYVNINTGGKWMRLDFYVSTGMNSARAEIELSLGNKYANNTLELAAGDTVTVGDKEESYDAVKVSYGLSSGTVFFDDVYMTSIDEAEYNALVYGFNNPEEADEEELKEELLKKNGDKYFYGLTAEEAAEIETMEKDELIDKLAEVREYNIDVTVNETDGYTVNYQTAPYLDETTGIGNYFHNGYVFKLIKRFTDSFDNYDERDEEELYQGDEPASYDHHAYTGFSQGKDDNPTILFGVYDREYDLENSTYIGRLFSNEDNTALNKADITEEALMRFLSTGADDGDDKVLLLANLGEAGGQYYRSSSSFSFSAESYYKITFRAKYLPLGEAGHTEFRFVYNTSDNKYEALTITTNSINDINYTTYSFYFYNENGSSLSAYLQFNLGSNESIGDGEREELFNNGFLLVDNVTIENITEVNVDAEGVPGEYTQYIKGELTGAVTGGYVNELVETEENPEDDPEDDPDEGGNKINPQVWLIVSSVVIGVIIIAVVIVLTYRKLKDKVSKKLKKTKVESKVPTDLEERAKKNELNRKAENKKTDIDAEDYRD